MHLSFQHKTSAGVCKQAFSFLRSLDGALLLQRSSAGPAALQTLRSQRSSLHSLHVSHQTLRRHHRPPAASFIAKCVMTNSSLTFVFVMFSSKHVPFLAECGPHLSLSTAQVHKQTSQCNDKKTLSKRVQELSSELYFGVFVKVGKQEPVVH